LFYHRFAENSLLQAGLQVETQIPFVNLKEQYRRYQTEIEEKTLEVLRSGKYVLGPYVHDFERSIESYLGVKHAIACSNGTDALILALLSAGIGAGDEVITSPFSFFATVEAILFVGAKPVFVDIEPNSFNINTKRIPEAITKATKAIMPVSLFGQPCHFKNLKEIAKTHKLLLIEDGAQSFGSCFKNLYSTDYVDISCTSFYPAKPLGTYGDGGAVFTNDDALAERCRLYVNHGQNKTYHHKLVGLNCRLDALKAALLQVKLKYYEKELAARFERAEYYLQGLNNLDLQLPYLTPQAKSAWAQFSILSDNREQLIKELKQANIPVAIHYPIPMYRQPAVSFLNCDPNKYPVTEEVCQKIFSLPICAFTAQEHQDYIISKLKSLVLPRKAYG